MRIVPKMERREDCRANPDPQGQNAGSNYEDPHGAKQDTGEMVSLLMLRSRLLRPPSFHESTSKHRQALLPSSSHQCSCSLHHPCHTMGQTCLLVTQLCLHLPGEAADGTGISKLQQCIQSVKV